MTGLICVVSAQTWPNLLGLLHFGKEIKRLYLYHSAEITVSIGPAERFKAWCNRQFPDLEVRLSGEEGRTGNCPEDVAGTVQGWIEAESSWNWIVNLTGGTKLMTCGLSDLIGATGERVRFIYRDIDSTDYELRRDGSGRISARAFAIAPDLADDLDIELLAQLQQGDKWTPQKARSLPILALTQAGFENRWNWVTAFEQCGVMPVSADGKRPGQGPLFEQFVAACLLQMGVKQVAINLKSGGGDPDQHPSEVDVVCLRHNQLHLFDCKLTTSEQLSREKRSALVTEINDTANRLRAMGGLGSKGFLLRPSRLYEESLKRLGGNQLKIWDQGVMTRFLDQLETTLQIPAEKWTPELRETRDFLAANVPPHGEAFSCRASFTNERTGDGDFPNLMNVLDAWAKDKGHAQWTGYVGADGTLHLHLNFATKLNCNQRECQLQAFFARWNSARTGYEISASKALITFPGLQNKARCALYKALQSGDINLFEETAAKTPEITGQ